MAVGPYMEDLSIYRESPIALKLDLFPERWIVPHGATNLLQASLIADHAFIVFEQLHINIEINNTP